MKRSPLLLALALSALTSCSPNLSRTQQAPHNQTVSYKLEDLCDTPIQERDLFLHIYVQDDPSLNSYKIYQDRFNHLIKNFFSNYSINCQIINSSEPLKGYFKPNKFALEIVPGTSSLAKRCFNLIPPKNQDEKKLRISDIAGNFGRALTKKGISFLNGDWYWESAELPFNLYAPDFIADARTSIHEILHQAGMFHPNTFDKPIVSESDPIPNIMGSSLFEHYTEALPPLGVGLTDWQVYYLHSYLAGNNAYTAFSDSNRDLLLFFDNIERDNPNHKLTEEQKITRSSSKIQYNDIYRSTSD